MTPPRRRRAALAGLAASALLVACGASETPDRPPAPVQVRATTVLEPGTLAIGETATVEVAVATPPDHHVRPPEPPEEVPGLWLLGAEALVVERAPQRWVHRARFEVRARETGRFAWPSLAVQVTDPEDATRTLEAPERPFEVVAVLEEGSGERPSLAFREPDLPGGGHPGLAALAGALLALAAVGLVLLVRRVRAAEPRGGTTGAAALPGLIGPWRAARATLERAEAQALHDPARAADLGASALRVLIAHRLDPALLARTTEELAAREPPSTLEAAWEELLALLRAFDAERFAPAAPPGAQGEAVHALLERARALADRLGPRGVGS